MLHDVVSPGNDAVVQVTGRGLGDVPADSLRISGTTGHVQVGLGLRTDAMIYRTGLSGAAVVAGRELARNTSGQLIHAVVTDNTTPVVGIAVDAASAAGQPVRYVIRGKAAGVLSAATVGVRYYLTGVAGHIGTTAPSTTGNTLTVVGYSESATDLDVSISDRGVA